MFMVNWRDKKGVVRVGLELFLIKMSGQTTPNP
jgi:hypothetical protein